jgi:hypothetical protein
MSKQTAEKKLMAIFRIRINNLDRDGIHWFDRVLSKAVATEDALIEWSASSAPEAWGHTCQMDHKMSNVEEQNAVLVEALRIIVNTEKGVRLGNCEYAALETIASIAKEAIAKEGGGLG